MRAPNTGNGLINFIVRCRNAYIGITRANSIILNNVDIPVSHNRVNLHYWVSSRETGTGISYNLGDDLSPIVVEKVLSRKGYSLDKPVYHTKHLYAVGSIISMGYQNATIWGSGFLQDLSLVRRLFHHYPIRRLDVRAVRGPKSRELLISLGHYCPEIYGDPVLLMPMFYTPPRINSLSDFVIIPHYSKDKMYRSRFGNDHIISMITNDYKSVIDRICSSKIVISSSLHGIILGEAYGIPTIFLRDRASEKDFKYIDYYASTNRSRFIYANSVEQALGMDPMYLPTNIEEMQNALLSSFPYDLWEQN